MLQLWEVVGGAEKGGILVREGKETTSTAYSLRLAMGALVLEEDLQDERLQYKLVAGDGPASGWVSMRLKDKPLLTKSETCLWKVVGGVSQGGIVVRESRDTSSAQLPERLAFGAVIAGRTLDEDERLEYRLVSGHGPTCGWVSIKFRGKDLLERLDRAAPQLEPTEKSLPKRKNDKMRVLVMAGSLSCTELMQYTTMQLRLAIGKERSEWVFAEGTVVHPWDQASLTVSEFERSMAKRKQLTSWYADIYHCSKDRPAIEKQFDPDVRVESVTIPDKVHLLKEFIREQGPFDAVVAFSQACIMVHYLLGHLRQSSEELPWRISVFFEGMHIRDEQYFNLFDDKCSHSTVHVFGTSSPYYTYSREGWCSPRRVEDYYENPTVLLHDEGHQFPFQQPRAKEIYDAVGEAMWQSYSSS